MTLTLPGRMERLATKIDIESLSSQFHSHGRAVEQLEHRKRLGSTHSHRSVRSQKSTLINQVEEYFRDAEPNVYNDYSVLKTHICGGSMNPHKPFPLIDYYIENEAEGDWDAVLEDIDPTSQYSRENHFPQNHIFVGRKGSGKTAVQNFWLHKNTEHMDARKILWTRADATKLHQLWQQIRAEFSADFSQYTLPDVQTYLTVQFVYVFAKYLNDGKKRPYQSMFDSIANKVEYFSEDPADKSAHNLKQFLVDQNAHIWRTEGNRTLSKNYSYAVDEVLRRSYGRFAPALNNWLGAGKELLNQLTRLGYKFMWIVDGIDNIHINVTENSNSYRMMVGQVRAFLLRQDASNHIKIITVRDRTWADLNRGGILYTAWPERPPKISYHVCSDKKDVLNARADFVERAEIAKYSPEWRGDREYEICVSEVFRNVGSSVDDAYIDNLRVSLHNLHSLTLVVLYRIRQREISITSAIVRQQLEIFRHRNYFLNGRLYADTYNDWSRINQEDGAVIFNLFYCREHRKSKFRGMVPYILHRIRLLQWLNLSSIEFVDLEDFVSVICKAYSYPDRIVLSAVEDLRAFGLLDTTRESEIYKPEPGQQLGLGSLDMNIDLESDFYSADPDRLQRVHLSITEKGRYFLMQIFKNIDYLYYLGFDTHIPSLLIDLNMVQSHINVKDQAADYMESAALTATTFSCYLIYVDRLELEIYNSNSVGLDEFNAEFCENGRNDLSEISKHVPLPWNFSKVYEEEFPHGPMLTRLMKKIDVAIRSFETGDFSSYEI